MAKDKVEAIIGFFRSRAEGEQAYNALLSSGYTTDQVSMVVGDTREHELPAIGPRQETGAEAEAGSGAVIGGMAGLAVGMIATVLPGIGALLAIGPLAGAIGGLGLGAATGGVIGMLRDHGVSEDEAEFYAEGVKRGGAIVTVHGVTDDKASDARKLLKHNGALDTEEVAEQWRREGWTGRAATSSRLETERG
jgi:hypothetical protein